MIRINLLSFKTLKSRVAIINQLKIFGLLILFVFVVFAFFYISLSGELSSLKGTLQTVQAEYNQHATKIKVINELQAKTKLLKSRLEVIKGLESGKQMTSFLFDKIASTEPSDRLWLSKLAENNGMITIEGAAIDNDTVALFMENLEKTGLLTSVSLQSAKLDNIQEYETDVTRFLLQCRSVINR